MTAVHGTMMDVAKILPSLLRDSDSEFGAALCVINRLTKDHGKYTIPEAEHVLRYVSCLPKRFGMHMLHVRMHTCRQLRRHCTVQHADLSHAMCKLVRSYLSMNEKELILAVIETFPSVVGTSFGNSLVGNEGDDETRAVVECFQEIVCTDRSYLIPVIGALGMFNLPPELQHDVFTLTINALRIVPEDDMPSGNSKKYAYNAILHLHLLYF